MQQQQQNQRYRVTIPQGVGPGSPFLVNVGGQQMKVVCPNGVGPGMQIEIQAPAAAPPMAPAPPMHATQSMPAMPTMSAPASPLGPQCVASQNAERQLAQMGGPPQASLIFTAMDRDGSGSVSVEELQFGLSAQGRLPFSRKTCQLLVNLYDEDRNGVVHEREFVTMWGFIEQWRSQFNAQDSDKSGRLTKAELRTAITSLGYRFSDTFFDKMFRAYDQEKKGTLGFDLFVQLFCELHMLTEAFKERDTQRNGTAVFQYEQFLDAAFNIHG
jgi:Ca2+-binding EF-hand superfamily protein